MAGFSLSVLWRAARGLSARLLVLTIFFVLLGEVFIYVPSIARHRLVFLEERIDAARIAALAVEASPDGMVTEELRAALLSRAGVSAVSIKRPGSRRLVLGDDMPVTIDASFDLREATPMRLIGHAADTLRLGGDRMIRVMGTAPGDSADTVVEVVLPEAPMYASMLDYSRRIMVLSIILAVVVAGLVYLSLHWLMVLPLGRMTDSLVSFRRAPEDAGATVRVSGRRDEIGLAQRELQVMQRRVRAALRQKARLAALGAGVAKINHDLRNMLATAAVLTDSLATARDPEVQRLAMPLVGAIDRAIALCTQTLSFATGRLPAPRRAPFALAPLVDEVRAALPIDEGDGVAWRNEVPAALAVTVRPRPALPDRHQPGAERGGGTGLPGRGRGGARRRLARGGRYGHRGRRYRPGPARRGARPSVRGVRRRRSRRRHGSRPRHRPRSRAQSWRRYRSRTLRFRRHGVQAAPAGPARRGCCQQPNGVTAP